MKFFWTQIILFQTEEGSVSEGSCWEIEVGGDALVSMAGLPGGAWVVIGR